MKAKNVGKRIAGFLYKEKAIAAILAVVIVMIFVNPVFFSAYNLTDILKSATVLVTIGCGLTPVIICHGCDLSLGGQMCLASILMVKLMPYIPIWLCAVVCILIGCFIGALNGFLVVHQKTEPFVITLGVGILLKGINQLLTDAHPIAGTSDWYLRFSVGKFLGIPYISYIMFIAIIITAVLLRYTQYGRNCYAVGGDYDIAENSGINALKVKWLAYIYCGLMTAVGGILLSVRLNSGASTHGETTALLCNCGAVLGGTSFAGGVGGAVQTSIGILLFSVLESALGMTSLSAYVQESVEGMIIVLIIGIDCYIRRRQREAV